MASTKRPESCVWEGHPRWHLLLQSTQGLEAAETAETADTGQKLPSAGNREAAKPQKCHRAQRFQHTGGDGAQALTLNFLPFVESICAPSNRIKMPLRNDFMLNAGV